MLVSGNTWVADPMMVTIPDPLASAEKVVRAQLGSCYLEVVHEGAEALM